MRHRSGFTFIELLTAMVIVGILAGLATPRFDALVTQIRARGALAEISGEMFRARMLAVRSGLPYQIEMIADGECVTALRIGPDESAGVAAASITRPLDRRGLCIKHTGRASVIYDARGVLRPTGLRISVDAAGKDYAIVVSSGGRIRRLY